MNTILRVGKNVWLPMNTIVCVGKNVWLLFPCQSNGRVLLMVRAEGR